jgi:hypothetical protein
MQYRKFLSVKIIVFCCFFTLFTVCITTSKKAHFSVTSACFITSDNIAIVVNHYRGGDGMPLSGDEHAVDYHDHLYHYKISSNTLTDLGVFQETEPDGGGIAFTNSYFTILDRYNVNLFSVTDGKVLHTIPDRISMKTSALKKVSPNGRYLFFHGYNFNDPFGQVYDLNLKTFGPLIPNPRYDFIRFENDGDHYLALAGYWDSLWLVRGSVYNQIEDTLGNITGYSQVYKAAPHLLLVKDDKSNIYNLNIDTASVIKFNLIPLGITGDVVDVDTSSGRYITISSSEPGAFLHNYKTGEPRKQMYFFNE